MSDDNIISFTPKISKDTQDERIEKCLRSYYIHDPQHENCVYCKQAKLTGRMLVDILVQDMVATSKKMGLTLTSFDLRNAIAHAYERVMDIEYEIHKEKQPKEAGKNRQGPIRLVEIRQSQNEERDPTTPQGDATSAETGKPEQPD